MQIQTAIPLPSQEIDDFCRRWHVTELALFGSVLREDFNAESDVDVLVTFGHGVVYTFRQLTAMQDELETILGRPVDLLDKEAVQQSPNYIRRKAILDSSEIVYAQ